VGREAIKKKKKERGNAKETTVFSPTQELNLEGKRKRGKKKKRKGGEG